MTEPEPLPPRPRPPTQLQPRTEPLTLAEQIGARATRKLKARRAQPAGVWFGLGMMGLVGWSISVPTVLGAALGAWLDRRYPGQHAWTLALLVAGLTLGGFNAWRWVAQEDRAMHSATSGEDDGGHD